MTNHDTQTALADAVHDTQTAFADAINELIEAARETVRSEGWGDKRAQRDAAQLAEARRCVVDLYERAQKEALRDIRWTIKSRLDNYPQFDEAGDPNVLYIGTAMTCKVLLRDIDSILGDGPTTKGNQNES